MVAEPEVVTVTVPVGLVGLLLVSTTFTSQPVFSPTAMGDRVQLTWVTVGSRLDMVIVTGAVLVLVACVESPLYVPLILAVPVLEGVKVLVHVDVPVAVPATRLHVAKVPVAPVEDRATVPVGVVGPCRCP
jgi:hypothetical protein